MVDRTNDHWWPIGIQKKWVDSDGFVSRLSSTGELQRLRPANHAKFARGHEVSFGNSPWDHSFENDFAHCGSSLPAIAAFLEKICGESKREKGLNIIVKKLVDKERLRPLLLAVISLLLRNPYFRSKWIKTPSIIGMPDDANIMNLNMRSFFNHANRIINNRSQPVGRFIVFFSKKWEFCYGDGFLDNITGGLSALSARGTCFVPLTRNLAVYYFTPAIFYNKFNIFTVQIDLEDVLHLNSLTQIYSGSYIYFRNINPGVDDNFALGEHRQIPFHRDDYLGRYEKLVEVA